jgi:hypothetical protein
VVRLPGVVDGKTVGTCILSLGTDVGALYFIAADPTTGGAASRPPSRGGAADHPRVRPDHRDPAGQQRGEPVYRGIGFATVARYRLLQLPK